jgi:drug/metabolite transporter (DMT)-like permease
MSEMPIREEARGPHRRGSERTFEEEALALHRSRSELWGLLEITLAMTLAGSTVVVGKILSVRVPVFLSAELSLCAAFLAVLPAQVAHWRELRLLGARELGYMLLQALFGIVLFRALTLYGLRFTSAVHAGLVTSAAPALMAVFAGVFLKERIGGRGLVGIGFTMAGLLAINLPGLLGTPQPDFLMGDLLVLGATACEAFLTIFRKSSGGRIGSVTNTTVLVAMSAVILLPFAILDLRAFRLQAIDLAGWISVLYYGAVATVIAYILWGDGALRIPASRTGIASAALSVSALVLSALILGERLDAVLVTGCSLVVAGIVIARK